MKSNKKFYLVLFLITLIASFLSFGRALFFHFSFDDWGLLWLAKNDLKKYFSVFTYHPLVFIAFYPWVYIFGVNPIYYNILGLVLKLLAALSFGMVFYKISKSKLAFLASSVVLASTYMGLEGYTFISARVTAVIIIFTNLILYLLISKKHFLLLGFLLFIAFWGDPAKVAFLMPVVISFLFIQFIQERKNLKFYTTLSFFVVGISFLGIVSSNFGRSLILPDKGVQSSLISQAKNDPSYYLNFLKSIGFIFSSYFSIEGDFGKVSSKIFGNPENLSVFVSSLFLVIIFRIASKSNLKSHLSYIVSFFIGIYMAYFPNWAVFPYMNTFTNHRYQALSTLMFLYLVCYLVLFLIKNYKIQILVVSWLVILGLLKSFQVNNLEAPYRDYWIVEKVYKSQQKDIESTSDHDKIVFFNHGNSILLGNQLHWSGGGTAPYAFSKNITSLKNMPAYTGDLELAAKLVCIGNQTRPVIVEWVPTDKKVAIENVYSWEIFNGGHVVNTSSETRSKILEQCKTLTTLIQH